MGRYHRDPASGERGSARHSRREMLRRAVARQQADDQAREWRGLSRAERRRRLRAALRLTAEALAAESHGAVIRLADGSALLQVQREMEAEADALCGVKRKGAHGGGRVAYRHGHELGSIVLRGARVPVLRPRVRQAGKELTLQTYAAYQDAEMLSEATLHACILGVAMRGYRQDQAAHATLPEGVPVLAASRSTVSRRFARDTQALLEEHLARPLQGERYLALFLDGVQLGAHQILVALGLTAAGEKQVLGLREGDSENSAVCGALLEDLVARGLSTESGLLAVVDGGKGWAAGIARVFGARVLVQRCVVHKARNVLDKLPQTAQRRVKRALATAWTDPNPARAEQHLRRLADALQQEGYGEAAASLREGLEDTLTHLRLQVPAALARSLRSTNAIESMFSQHRRTTRRVSRWRHGKQAERWSAAALMAAEFRLRRLPGSRHLPALQAALGHHARQGGGLAVGA